MSIRADLEAAMGEAEVDTTPEPANEPQAVEAPEAPANEPMEAQDKPGRSRDDAGRFAKEKNEKPAAASGTEANRAEMPKSAARAKVTEEKPSLTPAPAPVAPPVASPTQESVKAPQSWRPQAREKFAALPPEVQKEIARVEYETQTKVRENAEAQKVSSRFRETIEPFIPLMRRSGAQDPFQAIGSLLQTADVLANGNDAQKAGMMARLFHSYGINIDHFAKALDGAPQQQTQQPRSLGPQDVERMLEQKIQAMRQQAMAQSSQRQLQEFEANPPEFYEDVRDRMADIMELEAKRGKQVTLQQAYDMACRIDPEISQLVQSRAKPTNGPPIASRQSKLAASSVKSTPAQAVANGDGREKSSIRDYLNAADEALSGR